MVRKQRAFTLVELLVVISIIALLMAMLIPAVTGAVQASKRIRCANNLKEIATALTVFESNKERFPGYVDRVFNINRSWAVAILPEMGRQDIYDAYESPVLLAVDQERNEMIEEYICPGDVHPVSGLPWMSYRANAGRDDNESNDYVPSRAHGIFHSRRPSVPNPVNVTLGYIADNDGASNTLLVGEDLMAWTWWGKMTPDHGDGVTEYFTGFLWRPQAMDNQLKPINRPVYEDPDDPSNDSAPYFIGGSSPPVNTRLPFDPVDRTTGGTELGRTLGPSDCRLSSTHPGGVNVAFADKHVQFLSEDISMPVYNKLCTPNGQLSGQTPLSDAEWNFNK